MDLFYIASYPRSGNTWMRLLLSDAILQAHNFETDTRLPIHPDAIIPDLHISSLETIDTRLKLPCRLAKSHDRWKRLNGHAVCLYRLPADSLLSHFHFFRRYPEMEAVVAKGAEAFCRHRLQDWCRHLESFLLSNDPSKRIQFVSYEELHLRPVETLARVLNFIGFPLSHAICRRAVENHTFEKQRAKETLRVSDREYFYRQGKVNAAASELSAATLLHIHEQALPFYQRAREWEQRCIEQDKSGALEALVPSIAIPFPRRELSSPAVSAVQL